MISDAGYIELALSGTPEGALTFFDLDAFPWVRDVEARWQLVRAELDALMHELDRLPGFEELQPEQMIITTDRRWKVFPLGAYGRWPEYSARRCPKTIEALRLIPGLKAAMFSILQPRKSLPPHRGPYKGVLRYHLGLKVPRDEHSCGIDVGGDVRHWSEGKSLIFDDSHMHHAWNHSDEDRVVLFVDFVRPLPAHLATINERAIASISESDFFMRAMDRWDEWAKAQQA